MEDVIIVIAIIVFYIFLMYKKFQKQQAQQAAKRTARTATTHAPSAGDLLEEVFNHKPKNEKIEEPVDSQRYETNSSRQSRQAETFSKDNFSYDENIQSENFSYDSNTTARRSTETVKNADDEDKNENIPILSLETDELYKGFIYSEILKNPYNQ